MMALDHAGKPFTLRGSDNAHDVSGSKRTNGYNIATFDTFNFFYTKITQKLDVFQILQMASLWFLHAESRLFLETNLERHLIVLFPILYLNDLAGTGDHFRDWNHFAVLCEHLGHANLFTENKFHTSRVIYSL